MDTDAQGDAHLGSQIFTQLIRMFGPIIYLESIGLKIRLYKKTTLIHRHLNNI